MAAPWGEAQRRWGRTAFQRDRSDQLGATITDTVRANERRVILDPAIGNWARGLPVFDPLQSFAAAQQRPLPTLS